MTSSTSADAAIARVQETLQQVRDEVGKAIVGQQPVIEGVLTALLCGGHVLLEGVPGLGKTELVKAFGQVLELDHKRIQFTPDLMPADVLGTTVMSPDQQGGYAFEFRPGPIFTQLLLADEINRATPKTQSAMLETMQEAAVTTSGTTRPLTQPFIVLATQNPLEQEGTYPLPEAQLDRFLFKLIVPLPGRDDLNTIVERTILRPRIALQRVLDGAGILDLRRQAEQVVVAEALRDYAVRLVLASHPDQPFAPERVKRFVRWGASPRAAQALLRSGRVQALAAGRAHLAAADLRRFAAEVLQHRLILNYDGQAEGIAAADLVGDILDQVGEDA